MDLIGPEGIFRQTNISNVSAFLGLLPIWYAPTIFWLSARTYMLICLLDCGHIASLLLTVNFWPRGMLLICFVCFLSFVGAAQDFPNYQSDGMLLEAGFITSSSRTVRLSSPAGRSSPPSGEPACSLLLWEWFRIYFESGVVKLAVEIPTGETYRHG